MCENVLPILFVFCYDSKTVDMFTNKMYDKIYQKEFLSNFIYNLYNSLLYKQ